MGRVVYWIAVVAISLALVVGLILFFEARDQSQVETQAGALSDVIGILRLSPF